MIRMGRRELLLGAAAYAGSSLAFPSPSRAAWKEGKRYKDVFGLRMAYYEAGAGRPIVFIHGNPMSSYLWRKIIPFVQDKCRCIAPDLIGMGDSAKLPNAGSGDYSYETHRRYLFELFRQLGLDRDVILVIHDWGSALGFDFAAQHRWAIRGIAYMESFVANPKGEWRPNIGNGSHRGAIHGQYLTPDGERLILQENTYIENSVIHSLRGLLTLEDMAEYRRPFLTPGAGRWPMLEWPRQGQRKEVFEIKRAYSRWLKRSNRIPKLFIHAVPGVLFSQKGALKFALSLPNQTVVTVEGTHFVQEQSPDAVGKALSDWVSSLP